MDLLSSAKFNLKMLTTTNTDVTLALKTQDYQEVFDIIIMMNQPTLTNYDIIVSPFINIEVNSFDSIKKGDNPFDFMITDMNIINNQTVTVMKSLGRSMNYFNDKSSEQNKPLGIVDEYKPISQGVIKNKIDPRFYCLKLKNRRDINLTNNWVNGVLLVKYNNYNNKPSKSHQELLGRYNNNLIVRYGIKDDISMEPYLESNTISILSFWMKVNFSDTWFFKLESTETAQLSINNRLIIENYNIDTTQNATIFEYVMSEGFYKVDIRCENISNISTCVLKFFNRNCISWKTMSNVNLNNDAVIFSYIPDTLYDIQFKGLETAPLNDMINIQDVDYIFVNHNYYEHFYNAIHNDCVNTKNIGIPMADSVDSFYNLTFIKDGNSVNRFGWANDTTKNNGYTYFGYTFTSGINNLIKLDWFEYTDYNIRDGNLLKLFGDIDTKSSSIKVKIIFMDNTSEYISISQIDELKSKNINTNACRNDLLTKNSKTGQTIITLKEPIENTIKSVLIYRWDNIKKYWGIITEFNVYTKISPNIIDDIVIIDSNNTTYPLTQILPQNIPAFGFYNIPLNNSIDVTTADIEKVSKSNIITLYNENNNTKIKYNLIMS